ncbi:MAG TPA: MXAN_5187 C-terminal domain-containing protein [Terriglobia bacterium]|nr:MXAN_5187 C-terminal domain-containing protein [Terriglobia bacterium]
MTTEEELDQLEENIRRLKIEYEAYFNGGAPRAPRDTLFRVETALKKFGAGAGEFNFGQRFRFNQLAQKYAVYNDLWRKKLRDIEEGRVQPGGRRMESSEASLEGDGFRVVCADPVTETDKVDRLLDAWVRAKRKVGDRVDDVDPALFARFLREKTGQIKQELGCAQVRFSVSVEEGRVKLRAGKA